MTSLSLASDCNSSAVLSRKRWKFYPEVVSYCHNASEGKPISGVKHVSRVIPCMQYFIRKDHICNPIKTWCDWRTNWMRYTFCTKNSWVWKTLFIEPEWKPMRERKQRCRVLHGICTFQTKVECTLQTTNITTLAELNGHCSIFSVEPLYHLYLGISEKLINGRFFSFKLTRKKNFHLF